MKEGAAEGRGGGAALFLVCIVFLLLAPLFWRQTELRSERAIMPLEQSTLYQFVYPAYSAAFGALGEGRFPSWTDAVGCGAPLAADPRLGLFQPIHALFIFLPMDKALALQGFSTLFLMSMGSALFMRSRGLHWAACVGAGFIFAFSGASAAALSNPALLSSLAWVPWVFWALSRWLEHQRWPNAGLAGLFAGLSILGGALAIPLAFAPLGLLFLLLAAPADDKSVGLMRRFGAFATASALGLLIGAPAWLPAVLWTLREGGLWELLFAVGLDAPAPGRASNLLHQLVLVEHGPFPRLGYVSIGALIIAPVGLLNRRHWRTAAAALFGMLLAVGGYLLFMEHRPVFLLYTSLFCVMVLVGLGLDIVFGAAESGRGRRPFVPAAIGVVLAGMLFYYSGAQIRGYLLVYTALIVLSLVGRWPRYVSALGFLTAMFLFVDLSVASANVAPHPLQGGAGYYERYVRVLETSEEVLSAGEDEEPGRIYVLATEEKPFPVGAGMLTEAEMLNDARFSTPERLAPWLEAIRHAPDEGSASGAAVLMDAAAVRLVVLPDGTDAGPFTGVAAPQPVASVEGYSLWANPAAAPRVYWTDQWRVLEGNAVHESLVEASDQKTVYLGKAPVELNEVLAEGTPATSGALANAGAPANAEVRVARRSGYLRLETQAPGPGLVIVNDAWAPGWSATVNGDAAPVYRANGLFRAVVVPDAGEYTIEMRYRTPGLMIGLGSCATGLLICLALAVLGGRPSRRRKRAS